MGEKGSEKHNGDERNTQLEVSQYVVVYCDVKGESRETVQFIWRKVCL